MNMPPVSRAERGKRCERRFMVSGQTSDMTGLRGIQPGREKFRRYSKV